MTSSLFPSNRTPPNFTETTTPPPPPKKKERKKKKSKKEKKERKNKKTEKKKGTPDPKEKPVPLDTRHAGSAGWHEHLALGHRLHQGVQLTEQGPVWFGSAVKL